MKKYKAIYLPPASFIFKEDVLDQDLWIEDSNNRLQEILKKNPECVQVSILDEMHDGYLIEKEPKIYVFKDKKYHGCVFTSLLRNLDGAFPEEFKH